MDEDIMTESLRLAFLKLMLDEKTEENKDSDWEDIPEHGNNRKSKFRQPKKVNKEHECFSFHTKKKVICHKRNNNSTWGLKLRPKIDIRNLPRWNSFNNCKTEPHSPLPIFGQRFKSTSMLDLTDQSLFQRQIKKVLKKRVKRLELSVKPHRPYNVKDFGIHKNIDSLITRIPEQMKTSAE